MRLCGNLTRLKNIYMETGTDMEHRNVCYTAVSSWKRIIAKIGCFVASYAHFPQILHVATISALSGTVTSGFRIKLN